MNNLQNTLGNNFRNNHLFEPNFDNTQQTQQSQQTSEKFFNFDNPDYGQHVLGILNGNFATPPAQNIETSNPLSKAGKNFVDAGQALNKFNNFSNFPNSYTDDDGQNCINNYLNAACELLCQLRTDNKTDDYNFYSTLAISTLNKSIVNAQNYSPTICNFLSHARQKLIVNELDRHNTTKNSDALYAIVPQTYTGAELLDFVLNTITNTPKNKHKRKIQEETTNIRNTKKGKNAKEIFYLSQPGIRFNRIRKDTLVFFRKLGNYIRNKQYVSYDNEVFSWIKEVHYLHLTQYGVQELIVGVYATLLYRDHFFKRNEKTNIEIGIKLIKLLFSIFYAKRKCREDDDDESIIENMWHWVINKETPLWIADKLHDAYTFSIDKKSRQSIGIKRYLTHAAKVAAHPENFDESEKLSNPTFHQFLDNVYPGWENKLDVAPTPTDQ